MGTSKTEFFTNNQNDIASLLKALSHPARITIFEYLLTVDTCICGDIVNQLPLAQPTVSQHLKELKKAGIIKGTISGKAICYCVDHLAVEKIKNYFASIVDKMEQKNNQCC
jgi:DNA-binding transcriptional ArsR family regulator